MGILKTVAELDCMAYLSICVLFSALAHGICVLSADTLVEEALNAHHNGEEVSQIQRNFTMIPFH